MSAGTRSKEWMDAYKEAQAKSAGNALQGTIIRLLASRIAAHEQDRLAARVKAFGQAINGANGINLLLLKVKILDESQGLGRFMSLELHRAIRKFALKTVDRRLAQIGDSLQRASSGRQTFARGLDLGGSLNAGVDGTATERQSASLPMGSLEGSGNVGLEVSAPMLDMPEPSTQITDLRPSETTPIDELFEDFRSVSNIPENRDAAMDFLAKRVRNGLGLWLLGKLASRQVVAGLLLQLRGLALKAGVDYLEKRLQEMAKSLPDHVVKELAKFKTEAKHAMLDEAENEDPKKRARKQKQQTKRSKRIAGALRKIYGTEFEGWVIDHLIAKVKDGIAPKDLNDFRKNFPGYDLVAGAPSKGIPIQVKAYGIISADPLYYDPATDLLRLRPPKTTTELKSQIGNEFERMFKTDNPRWVSTRAKAIKAILKHSKSIPGFPQRITRIDTCERWILRNAQLYVPDDRVEDAIMGGTSRLRKLYHNGQLTLPEISKLPKARAYREIDKLVKSRVQAAGITSKGLRLLLEASINMRGEKSVLHLFGNAVKPTR